MPGINWSAVEAVGTVCAFFATFFLLLTEIRRDRKREEDKQRKAAGLVSAWPVRKEAHTTTTATTVEARVQLRNGGTEPVYKVVLDYLPSDGRRGLSEELGILPPGDMPHELPEDFRETWIWIKSDRRWIPRAATGTPETTDPFREAWRFSVAIHFVDTAGRRWTRDKDGSLNLERPAR